MALTSVYVLISLHTTAAVFVGMGIRPHPSSGHRQTVWLIRCAAARFQLHGLQCYENDKHVLIYKTQCN